MNYLSWIALNKAEYLTNKEKYNLVQEFENADNIFGSSFSSIIKRKLITSEKIKKLLNTKMNPAEYRSFKSKNIQLCSINDEDYPDRLRSIYAPPVLLYYKGCLPKKTCIAIVGSRKPSEEGKRNSYTLASALVKKGFCIVSGMATGIDSYAHKGALIKDGTTAVLGNGINICYPAKNRELMNSIENNGCVISEYFPQKNPTKYTFPARNRIISGISEAVVVVEAAAKSGALITADFALEQGREIFAFKYMNSEKSKGTQNLIMDGAIPVSSTEEFIALYT